MVIFLEELVLIKSVMLVSESLYVKSQPFVLFKSMSSSVPRVSICDFSRYIIKDCWVLVCQVLTGCQTQH